MAPKTSHSDHSSSPSIARGVKRPYPRALGGPPSPPIWSCSRWGLPCIRHHWRTGELLPRHFNLTRRRSGRRYVFCGTFPRSLGAVVNGHPVLGSPDFPLSASRRKERSLDPLQPAFSVLPGNVVNAALWKGGQFTHLPWQGRYDRRQTGATNDAPRLSAEIFYQDAKRPMLI